MRVPASQTRISLNCAGVINGSPCGPRRKSRYCPWDSFIAAAAARSIRAPSAVLGVQFWLSSARICRLAAARSSTWVRTAEMKNSSWSSPVKVSGGQPVLRSQ